jgi:hypothetical protein
LRRARCSQALATSATSIFRPGPIDELIATFLTYSLGAGRLGLDGEQVRMSGGHPHLLTVDEGVEVGR